MATGLNALAATFAFIVATGASAAPAPRSAADYFKDYALSTCIADGHRSEEVTRDAAAAARNYLEHGGFPLEAHTQATALGRKFLKREYRGLTDEPLVLMKCLDFYRSKELASLVRRYDRQSRR